MNAPTLPSDDLLSNDEIKPPVHFSLTEPEPTWGAQLDLLLHLTPYTAVLLVTGPLSAGRVDLLARFWARAAENWRIVTLAAEPALSLREVLEHLARGLGLALPDEADASELTRTLAQGLNTLADAGLRPVVVIDQAQDLSESAWACLVELYASTGAVGNSTLVLAGEHPLIEVLDTPALRDLNEHIGHRIVLGESPVALEGMGVTLPPPPRPRATITGHAPRLRIAVAVVLLVGLAALWGFRERINQAISPATPPTTQPFASAPTTTPSALSPEQTAVAQDALPAVPATDRTPGTPLPTAVTSTVTPPPPAPAAKAPITRGAPDPVPPITSSIHDAAWLLQQSPQAYTLQLMALATEAQLAPYLKLLSGDIATFITRRDGRRYHVLVWGVYSNRSSAEAAARKLPAGLQQFKPWVRRLDGVQRAVREASVAERAVLKIAGGSGAVAKLGWSVSRLIQAGSLTG